MALTESTMLELGTVAPDFALPDVVTGKTVRRDDFLGQKGLLVMASKSITTQQTLRLETRAVVKRLSYDCSFIIVQTAPAAVCLLSRNLYEVISI